VTPAAALLWALALAAGAPPASDLDALTTVCAAFSPYDRVHDDPPAITRLAPLGADFARTSETRPSRGLVLVLVEPRLLAAGRGPDLHAPLATWLGDLAAEGWDAVAIEAAVYAGQRRRDGATLLALREFLRAVARQRPQLAAVELVGAFPDARLVRRYAWWLHQPVTLNAGQPGRRVFDKPVDYLRWVPEWVAGRCDLVLGDLAGRWEQVYHPGPERLDYHYLVFPQGRDKAAEGAAATEDGALHFTDFFLVDDDPIQVTVDAAGHASAAVMAAGNAECGPADLACPNPLSRPQLLIGRLDARHAGVKPDPAVVDKDGRHLLDADGRPQALEFASAAAAPHPLQIWVPDEAGERRMLADWLDHRHRWRLGQYDDQARPASIGIGWGSAVADCRRAFERWRHFAEPGYDILRANVNLLEVVAWLGRPATLRALKTHGDAWGNVWGAAPPAMLDTACGPQIFNWRRVGARLIPTLAGTNNKLDFAVTRSLYESGKAPDPPALWLDTCCEATLPEGAWDQPYTAPRYGFWQSGECLLFHLHCLALIGRSKVFYDEPREMWAVLAHGGTMGDVWRHYFEVEAADPRLRPDNGIGCKRAYFWNVLGDATIRSR
jgi:hypothetical protein